MSEISEYNSYTIDDLVNVWESGWQYLEEFVKKQSSYKLKKYRLKSANDLGNLLSLLNEVLSSSDSIGCSFNAPDPCPSYIELLNLAASDSKNPYTPIVETVEKPRYPVGFGFFKGTLRRVYSGKLGEWSKDERRLKKVIKKLTSAFSESKTIGDVFLKIADKENIQLFKEIWSKQDFGSSSEIWAKKNYLETEINPNIAEFMKLLEYGTKSKKNAFEEAWWKCLWLYMKPSVDLMLDVKKRVEKDVPIYKQQIDTLNYYLSFGCPVINMKKINGAYKAEIILKPKEFESGQTYWSDFLKISIILLVQPAFNLSQKLQNSFRMPKYLRQCHAPSCGKYFWTYRNPQVVCSGSQGHNKTKCALEWKQFRYWLNALGKDPNKNWDNPKRKDEFLKRSH